jgi:hypothetical protein
VAIFEGTQAEWKALIEAIRNNCERCTDQEMGRLCEEHRRLVTTDQRFLDHMMWVGRDPSYYHSAEWGWR